MSYEATSKRYVSDNFPYWGSLSSIRRIVGKEKTVLDVGCASGYLGDLLMRDGNIMYGVDGNRSAIEKAKGRYEEALCIDLNEPAHFFNDTRFDVIVFADVLEHLLDPESILRYCTGLLKPNGRIIVSLPNVALWRIRLQLLCGRFQYTDYGVLDKTHLHLYTFKTAKELMQVSGLRTISERGAMNFMPFGILVSIFPFLKSWLSIHIVIEAEKSST